MPAAPRGPGRPGLWRHRDFLLLWAGQSISELGSAVTLLALPLTAVVVLGASTFDVGLLAAATTVPFLLIALPAGLAVDRMAKRGLMIGCDAARMLIIGSVPIAAGLGKLTLFQLYAVAVATGVLTVFFDVAYQSFTPALIEHDQLPDGNGKLAATQAFAQVAWPGLGGGLFGLLRAGALAADAVSFAVSTVSLLLIRAREPAGRPRGRPQGRRSPGCARSSSPGSASWSVIPCCARSRPAPPPRTCSPRWHLDRDHLPGPRAACPARLHGPAGRGRQSRRGRRRGRLRPAVPLDRLGQDHLGCDARLRRARAAAASGRARLAAGLRRRGRGRPRVLWRALQHRAAQLPAGDLPAGAARSAERGHPLDLWGTLPLGSIIGGTLGSVLGVRPTMWIGMTGGWAAPLWVLFPPLRRMRDVPGPGDEFGAGWAGGPAPGSPPGPGRRGGPGAARPAVQEP
jgi:Major Facilitator Superfamily